MGAQTKKNATAKIAFYLFQRWNNLRRNQTIVCFVCMTVFDFPLVELSWSIAEDWNRLFGGCERGGSGWWTCKGARSIKGSLFFLLCSSHFAKLHLVGMFYCWAIRGLSLSELLASIQFWPRNNSICTPAKFMYYALPLEKLLL